MNFFGLNPASSTPFFITLRALDAAGNVLETIRRRVRLGKYQLAIALGHRSTPPASMLGLYIPPRLDVIADCFPLGISSHMHCYVCALFSSGFNLDCAVVFVNGDESDTQLINGNLYIEFMPLGPVETMECRFEPVGQDNFGDFIPCKFQLPATILRMSE